MNPRWIGPLAIRHTSMVTTQVCQVSRRARIRLMGCSPIGGSRVGRKLGGRLALGILITDDQSLSAAILQRAKDIASLPELGLEPELEVWLEHQIVQLGFEIQRKAVIELRRKQK